MIVAFTGTRNGLTPAQERTLAVLLTNLKPGIFFHGGCRGADLHAEVVCLRCDHVMTIRCFPGDDKQLQNALKRKTNVDKHHNLQYSIWSPQPYLVRNRDMVDQADLLIAAPSSLVEERSSGTWSTVRYARKVGKPVVVLDP